MSAGFQFSGVILSASQPKQPQPTLPWLTKFSGDHLPSVPFLEYIWNKRNAASCSVPLQVLNLRTDELLISFKQEVAVTSLTFRTDAAAAQLPLLASGGGDGRICLWDLKERRLHHTMGAHEGGISKLQFLPR